MCTSGLRRHFDTLQSTGNGSSLLELQRGPDAIPLLLALLQEELAPEPPPVAVPAVLLLGTQMLQKCLRRCTLEAASGVEALLLPALVATAARGWRPVLTQLALALVVVLIRQVAWPESTLLSQLLGQLSGERSAVERVAYVVSVLAADAPSVGDAFQGVTWGKGGGVQTTTLFESIFCVHM